MQTNCFGAYLSSANNMLDVVCCAKHARDLLFVASGLQSEVATKGIVAHKNNCRDSNLEIEH